MRKTAIAGLSDGRKRCQQTVVIEFVVRTGGDEF